MKVTRYASELAWLDRRREGIGASDCAPILNRSPWRTPLDVWFDKRNVDLGEQRADTPAKIWGARLEPLVIADAAEQAGVRFERLTWAVAQSDDVPFMLCSPDGFVLDDHGERVALIEVKTAASFKAEDWSEGVPPYYADQIQHGCFVTGMPRCLVGVFLGTHRGVDYCWVERDPAWWETHKAALSEFWRRVETDDPPPAGADDAKRLVSLYPKDDGAFVLLPEEFVTTAFVWDRLVAERDQAEEELAILGARVREAMKTAERGMLPDGSGWSWKTDKRGSRPLKRLARREEREVA